MLHFNPEFAFGGSGASPNSRYRAGKSYVIYGSASNPGTIDLSVALASSQGFAIYGGTAYDYSGYSVAGAGDVNKDGYADIIIGAYAASPSLRTNAGESYVIYGSATNPGTIDLAQALNGTRGFTVLGGAANDYSGVSVSAAGDVNNDGFADFVIGAAYADPWSIRDAATSYVIYGSSTNPVTIDLSIALTSSQGFALIGSGRFGYSVSAAGDVNHDGFDDIIIGAYWAQSQAGISYLIYGSSSNPGTINLSVALTNSQGFAILGGTYGEISGYSVNAAGDVNKDGYADMIIGAPYASPSSRTNAGKSYVIYGSASNQGTIDLSTTALSSSQGFAVYGGAANDRSGWSVSGAGDVNGDGYADIIVGAPYANNTAGASYVIYGGMDYPTSQPSSQPTKQPLNHPSSQPSRVPTSQPTGQPSRQPSKHPSMQPCGQPSSQPVDHPTSQPSGRPSDQPNDQPTGQPSMRPSGQPTSRPKEQPSVFLSSTLKNSLVAYYPFDGNAYDKSGNGNNGVVHSVTPSTDRFGNPASSYSFNGVSSYIEITNGAAFNFVNDMSLSMWVNPANSQINNAVIISKSHGSAGWFIEEWDGGPTFVFGYYYAASSGYYTVPVITGLIGNTWNHLAIIKKDGTTHLYVNGVLASTGSSASTIVSNGDLPLTIGALNSGYTQPASGLATYFNGLLDELRIYNRTLSAAEVKLLYDFESPTSQPSSQPSIQPTKQPIDHPTGQPSHLPSEQPTHQPSSQPTNHPSIEPKSIEHSIDLFTLSKYQGVSISGAVSNDKSGYSVSNAGDFNGDGFDDIIIGAYQASPNGKSHAGVSYIIYGSNSPNNFDLLSLPLGQGFSILGANAGDNSGYSVSGAGDFNGDGYADIIIGAPYAASGAGISYIIYGNTNLTSVNLNNLSPSQGISITGASVSYKSGYSVSSAGDFNKDGKTDVIIGAYNPTLATGVSYIIYGSSLVNINLGSLIATQGLSITGITTYSQVGIVVNKAGDINHDGIDDVIIGLPSALGASPSGKSFVVYGVRGNSSINIDLGTLTTTQGFYISGQHPGDASGYSVSGLGDINNDGYADIIIGDPSNGYAQSNAGAGFVVLGKPGGYTNIGLSMSTSAQGFYIEGANSQDFCGISVSGAGDINNDGINDMIISSYHATYASRSQAGSTCVIYGKASSIGVYLGSFAATQGFCVYGANAGDNSGYSASGAGDFNGDGIADIIIGAPYAGMNSRTGAGASYIIYGGISYPTGQPSGRPTMQPVDHPSAQPTEQPTSKPSVPTGQPSSQPTKQPIDHPSGQPSTQPTSKPTIQPLDHPSSQPSDQPTSRPTEQPTNHPSIEPKYIGKSLNLATLTKYQGFTITGTEQAGYALSSGDVNGDGKPDMIIGAPGLGIVYIVYGGGSSLSNINLASLGSHAISITGPSDTGYSVSSGDVNGDNITDIIIGADTYFSNTGRVYIVYGHSNLTNINLANLGNKGIYIAGINANDYTGRSVGNADINGDGKADIIIGAARCILGATCLNIGKAYVIFGGNNLTNMYLANLTNIQGISITGTSTGDFTGYAVSGAGDINNDGFDEFMVVSYEAYKSYIVYGNSTLLNINLATLTINHGFFISPTDGGSLWAISSIGDINKDSYADFAIAGAYSIYIFFGKASGFSNIYLSSFTSSQGFIITSSNQIAYPHYTSSSGRPLSGAGDFNGDGYDDFIIGNAYSSSNYKSYIIFGKENDFSNINLDNFNTAQGMSITSTASSMLGWAASGTGDINSDGYDDVIIGSYSSGVSYVVYGGMDYPTSQPSGQPSMQPSEHPSSQPTDQPTRQPTSQPSIEPKYIGRSINLATLTSYQGVSIVGATAGDQSGYSVSYAGDVNRDGYDDVIISAPSAASIGIFYVVYGSTSLGSTINLANLTLAQGFSIISVPASSGNIYSAASGVGDVNNDGYDDIIIGFCLASRYGEAYVIYGNASLPSTINLSSLGTLGFLITIPGTTNCGWIAGGAGDVNKDGYADMMVSNPNKPSNAGITYVIYGGASLGGTINVASLTSTQGFSIIGASISYSGSSLSSAGDVNRDGYDDIIIGTGAGGIAYIIYGGLSLPSSINLESLGALGFSISGGASSVIRGAGDINNDGYDDIIVGVPLYPSAGSAYIIYGGLSLPSSINLGSLGALGFSMTTGGYFANSVSNVGDINGDGYDDVIIGSYIAHNDAGVSYIVYGSVSKNGTMNVASLTTAQGFSVTGALANSGSGTSVCGAGDVNKDGYADIIIGAPYANSNAGISYIIYGGVDYPTSQPSSQPSEQPTRQPVDHPTAQPSRQPSEQPTSQPIDHPSTQPSGHPSSKPTKQPTDRPSDQPSTQPSGQPFDHPSDQPSEQPSDQPSGQPTSRPTEHPTGQPSDQPSRQPTEKPSSQPTDHPSEQPFGRPSMQPTSQPTSQPIDHPSMQPSAQPSSQPTEKPSAQPLSYPSGQPSEKPSGQPTSKPAEQPTDRPSEQPSARPSAQPTDYPTGQPSSRPSDQPTEKPSTQPIDHPSMQPSDRPSTQPTERPSSQPSSHPSMQPSDSPSAQPLRHPTAQPSDQPSGQPSTQPSIDPTAQPKVQPSEQPTSQPSIEPATQPTLSPTDQPTDNPSEQPTVQPTSQPSDQPTRQPTMRPSKQPYAHPSGQPSEQPSNQPTLQPTAQPSNAPTAKPVPTAAPTSISLGEFPDDSAISVTGTNAQFKIIFNAYGSYDSGNGFTDINVAESSAATNYVVFGGNSLKNINLAALGSSQGFSITPAISYDNSYRSVANAGDINGDGYDDLVIGTPLANVAYVLFGTTEGFVNMRQGFTIFGAQTGDQNGWSVAGSGDFNGDGYADIIISAANVNYGTGAAYIIWGKKFGFTNIYLDDLDPTQGIVISAPSDVYSFGTSVSGAGDVNGDGFDDVVISSTGSQYAVNNAYIIFGRAGAANIDAGSLSLTQGFIATATDYSFVPYSVSSAGDVNGDGYDDILIGSTPRKTGFTTQISYLIYGKAHNNNIDLNNLDAQGIVISGGGVVVSYIGDVNNDGFDDMMIGNNYDFSANGFVIFTPGKFTSAPSLEPTSVPSDQPGSLPTSRPSLVPSSLPSDHPSDYPTTHPSRPTIIPTVIPTSPTSQPTSTPSNPTKAPTLVPTAPSAAPTIKITDKPTTKPTAIVTIIPSAHPSDAPSMKPMTILPSIKPTANPTDNPSQLPSFAYTSNPTKAPTKHPTLRPTALPTLIPSEIPTILPTNGLASGGYITINIADGGIYYRSALKTHFILNSTKDVKITGKGGHALFIVIAHPKVHYVISNFNQSSDLISLQDFKNIHSMQDLNFTMGSIIINLVKQQRVILSNLNLLDIAPNNFIFAPAEEQNKKSSNTGFIAGISVASVAMVALSSGLYYYITQDQPFKLVVKTNTVAPEVEDPIDLEKNAPTNHPAQETPKVNTAVPMSTAEPTDIERNIPVNRISQEILVKITKDKSIKKQNTDDSYDSDNFEVPEYSSDEHDLTSAVGLSADGKADQLKIVEDKTESSESEYSSSTEQSDQEDEDKLSSETTSSDDGKAVQLKTAGDAVDNDDSEDLDDVSDKSKDSSSTEWSDQEDEEFISEKTNESESELRPALSASKGNVRPTRKPSPQPSSVPSPQPSMQPSSDSYYTQALPQSRPEISTNKVDSGNELILAKSTVKFNTPLVQLKDISLRINPKVEAPKLEPNFANHNQLFNLNQLIYTASNIRQLVEYSPIIKYTGKNIIYPMIENHLPESLKNITYPEILDSKVFLFTTHLAVGHAAVMLLPQESITNGLVISTAGSGSFGIRLAVSHYLSEQRENALSQDKPMDAYEITKYCVTIMLAHTMPSIATCVIDNFFMPDYKCGELALSTRISIAGAECYSVYKASTKVVKESTTTDIVVPYIADGLALMTSCASGGSMLSVVSSVVTADYLTRVAMDMVPNEFKESYIDPVLHNVNEAITSVSGNVYGCFYNAESNLD